MSQQEMNNEATYEESLKPESIPQEGKGLSTAALVLGIIGISTSFIPIVNNASFVLGILAVIFGVISLVKKVGTKKAIASLILGILSIVITLTMQLMALKAIEDAVDEFNDAVDEFNDEMDYMDGDKTDEVLDKFLSVNIGRFHAIEGEYFDECELEVTLKNKGNETSSFEVEIEAVDENGNRIDVDYIYVSNLGAGQSQKFKIFTLVPSDKYAQLKQATFRVIEASKY